MEFAFPSSSPFPDDAILSVRVGASRFQANASKCKVLKFPRPDAKASAVVKFDILSKIGSGHLVLKPLDRERSYTVDAGAGMKFEVGVKETEGAISQPVDASGEAAAEGDGQKSSQEYMDRHNLLPFLQGLLQVMLNEKPDDPFLFMAGHVLSDYLSEQDLADLLAKTSGKRQASAAAEEAPPAGGAGLQLENLPSNIREMHYAVRGEVDQMAQAIAKQLKEEGHNYPFSEIVPCHIGNPQAVGQTPLTFHRQIVSLMTNPELLDRELYPSDVHDRARQFSATVKCGAYSHTQGAPALRQKVADYITQRDGKGLPPADPDSLFLTNGASAGVKMVLPLLVGSPDDGVLIPVPQYPLYSALLTMNRGSAVPYYLDEDAGWAISMGEVGRAVDQFRSERPSGKLKAMVVINPGNPTGNIMSRQDMEDTIRFCHERGCVLIADEVYQHNLWSSEKQWESFRSVAMEMDVPVQIISLHSISKGYYGECGIRGGFVQLHNISTDVRDQMYKVACMEICANSVGQCMIASVMNPPGEGDASHGTYSGEAQAVLDSMQRRSKLLSERLASLPGMSCNPIEGAMYAFPRIEMPPAAVAAAEAAGKVADVFYCLELVKATGIATVPGSGFKQKPGTHHFRITFLPAEEKLPEVLDRLESFHRGFLEKYYA